MRMMNLLVAICLVGMLSGCGETTKTSFEAGRGTDQTEISNVVLEASCGQCQFDMEGNGCTLAVRIDGVGYYVDGASIDDYGDAHAEDGLCNAMRQANVSGQIEDGRFVATSFDLLPAEDE